MDSLNCAKKNQINGQREIHRFYAEKLAEIPICNATDAASGWNRYDTDNQHVLHIWTDGKSYDIAVPKEDQARELGDGEPSPEPRETDGHPVGWCCKHCYDGGYQAAMRLLAEGDTRELKAALRKLIQNSSRHDHDDARIVDAADLIEVERLLSL